MKTAIIHEWLTTYAGSERVLEQIIASFPDADLFALVDFLPADQRGFLRGRSVNTSFMQNLPMARRLFRNLFFLMPLAVEQFDLSSYDLVISSSHAVAKGVLTGPDQVHVSYVHSPMRYAWDMQHQYLRESGVDRGWKGIYARLLLHWMRIWDVRTANGVAQFVCNSSYIARRIWRVYRREALVVYPPADIEAFTIGKSKVKSYLVAGRLVPYKRVDLAVKAFVAMPDRELIVVGSGPALAAIVEAAAGAPNIKLVGQASHAALVEFMQEARALIFPGEEDFGITMVEAQACGTPVLAYGRGGACDIIGTGGGSTPTGLLIEEQSVEAIIATVERFETTEHQFEPEQCRVNALRFSEQAFRDNFKTAVMDAWASEGPDRRLAH